MNIRLVALASLIAVAPTAMAQQVPVVNHGGAVKQAPLETKPIATTNRLVVKFRDDASVRLEKNGQIAPVGEHDLTRFNATMQSYGASFKPYFKTDRAKIDALRQKALQASGKLFPDLNRVMYVNLSNPAMIAEAKRAFQQMPEVEWVEWDYEIKMHSSKPLASQYLPALPGLGGSDTPDLTGSQDWYSQAAGGYDAAAFHSRGQFILDNNLQHQDWPGGNGGMGANVKVGVIDFGIWRNHEDLAPVNMEPGIPMLPPGIDPAIFAGYNHGTACMGILGARDNDFGMLGIAPEAELWFFPSVSFSAGRLPEAFIGAYQILGYGDILSVSLGLGDRPLYFAEPYATLMLIGNAVGVTTFISAGNESNNLTDFQPPESMEDGIPCIVVGAGFPTWRPDGDGTGTTGGIYQGPFTPFGRLGFSNFFFENDVPVGTVERRIDLQAWGVEVASLGYGDLFLPAGSSFSRFNRSYTDVFSGTSAACPLIAGLAANVQGLAKMFYGTALTPADIRDILTGNTFRQEGTIVDLWVSHELPITDEDFPGDDDFSTVNDNVQVDPDGLPYQESQIIGGHAVVAGQLFGFPVGQNILEDFFTNPWFGVDTELVEYQILTGTYIRGSILNLGIADGVGIEVASKYVSPRSQPQVDPFPEARYVFYGQATDIGYLIVPTTDNDTIFTMNITYANGITSGAPFGGFRGTEVWNWDTGRWDFVAIESIPSGGSVGGAAQINAANQYFGPNDTVLFRQWIYGFTFTVNNQLFEGIYDQFVFGSTSGGVGGGADDPG